MIDLTRRALRFSLLTIVLAALTACGGGGSSGSTNRTPAASFTASPTSGTAPLTVALNASASSDSDGSITAYSWTFGDGGTATGVTAQHVYSQSGTYTITLTVTDDDGARGQATRTVEVTGNDAPVAEMQYEAGCGLAPLQASFDASRSYDFDGNIATYSWNFGDGTTGTGPTVAHTYNSAGTFPVVLTVTDTLGLTSQARGTVTVLTGPGTGTVSVNGQVTFERVPHRGGTDPGLNYAGTFAAPARDVIVELVSSGGPVLASTLTNDSGQYSFNAAANTNVFVRARAEACGTSPRWQVRVLNNTAADPLTLYVLDSQVFNTGTTSQTRNLLADSGWPDFGGTSYVGPRTAAPFAVLDTLRSAARFVQTNGDAGVELPALSAFWSTENRVSDAWIPATGSIQSTLYRGYSFEGAPPGIYVLGLQNNDTDEYDAHVVAHEFQHFLEDAVARNDSPGGSHSLDERLDMRLAYSEGFANAFSAMVVGSSIYKDSAGTSQLGGFSFDVESNTTPHQGWFNESTIHSVVWDVFDSSNDGTDTISLGYGPIYAVMTNELRGGPALISIYPLLQGLKTRSSASNATVIDSMATERGIFGTGIYGGGETNDGDVTEALPVYTELTLNGAARRVCGTTEVGVYNKLGNRLFLRFSLPAAQTATIRAEYSSFGSTAPLTPTADPDIVLYRNGLLTIGESEVANLETLTRPLDAGDYVIEVYEYSHVDELAVSRRGITCFNVSVAN